MANPVDPFGPGGGGLSQPIVDESVEQYQGVTPKYSDEGRILFRVYVDPTTVPELKSRYCCGDRYQIEILDYDADSSVLWLDEGVGLEYALLDDLGLGIELSGDYVVEGVHGEYHRGDGWTTDDDDEEWYFGPIRRATEEESRTECLEDR